MAIAHVGNWTSAQFNNSTGGSTASRTSTANNLIVVSAHTSDTAATIADNKSNTFTAWTAAWTTGGAGWYGRCYYKENAAGGASHTISLTTGASQYSVLNATEYSGIATSSSVDRQTVTTGSSTTLSSGATATTTQNDELCVGIGHNNPLFNTTYTATGGYTLRGQITDATIGGCGFLTDLIVSTTGAQTATATHAENVSWVMGVITFKAAGGVSASANAVAATVTTTANNPTSTISSSTATVAATVTTTASNPAASGPTAAPMLRGPTRSGLRPG